MADNEDSLGLLNQSAIGMDVSIEGQMNPGVQTNAEPQENVIVQVNHPVTGTIEQRDRSDSRNTTQTFGEQSHAKLYISSFSFSAHNYDSNTTQNRPETMGISNVNSSLLQNRSNSMLQSVRQEALHDSRIQQYQNPDAIIQALLIELDKELQAQLRYQIEEDAGLIKVNQLFERLSISTQISQQQIYLHQSYEIRNDVSQDEITEAIEYLYEKSSQYINSSNIYKAVLCLEKCQQLFRHLTQQDINEKRSILKKLGNALMLQGRYPKARERIRQAYDLYQGDQTNQTQCKVLQGKCQAEIYNYDYAVQLLEKARKKINQIHHFENEEGSVYNDQFDLLTFISSAIKNYLLNQIRNLIVSEDKRKAQNLYREILITLGLISGYRSKTQKAIQYYLRLIEQSNFQNINFTELLKDGKLIISTNYAWETILRLIEKYLPYFQSFKKSLTSEFILIYKHIGQLYAEQGYFTKSYQKLKQAQNIMKQNKLKNQHGKSILLKMSGLLQLNYHSDYSKALDKFFKQLNVIKQSEGRFTLNWVEALNRIGAVCLQMGKKQQAVNSFKKCLKCTENFKNYQKTYVSTLKVHILVNLIETEIRFNQSQQVQVFFQQIKIIKVATQSLRIERQIEQGTRFYNLAGQFYTSLSIAYQQRGQLQPSLKYAIKALQNYSLSQEDYNFTYRHLAKLRISYLLQKSNKLTEALEKYHQVLQNIIALKGEKVLIVAEIQNQIGCIYLQLKRYAQGIEFLKKQMEIRLHFSTTQNQQKVEVTPFVYEMNFLQASRHCYKHIYQSFKKSQQILNNLYTTHPQIYDENIEFIAERNEYIERIIKQKIFQFLRN